MRRESSKPSDVVYLFLHGIATIAVNLTRLTVGCLWMLGAGAVKLATGSKEKKATSK